MTSSQLPSTPRVVEGAPGDGPVLVVAPHPDDETLGPGGVIGVHVAAGHPVHALFVTSGVHGEPGGGVDPIAYVATRRAEAEAAARVLQLSSTTFWELPDSMEVSADDLRAVTDRLVEHIDALAPALIYCPHPGEHHTDHHFTALAVLAATPRVARPPKVLGYEVWSPLVADIVVDVTESYPAKIAATRCYPSQLIHTDLCGAVEGMNRYRAILLPDAPADGSRRAEAFKELA